jgi:hypothetical protein
MTNYKVTVQGIEYKTFQSTGYNMVGLMEEINQAIHNNSIHGFDASKPVDIKVTEV